jgi:monoamine oxidase
VAVIGGGVAGTYCAWRLATSGPLAPSVALFEASGRIGGRLWSQAVSPVTNQVAELGGMRIPSDHIAMLDLITHLGLVKIPFYASSPNTLVRLRGERIRRGDVQTADQFPYDLPARIARLSPDEIIALIQYEVGIRGPVQAHGLETGPWLAGLNYQGRPLWQMRVTELLQAILGREGAEFISDWIGFEVPNIAASTWIGLVSALTGVDFVAIDGGYQQVPLTMANRATQAGASISTDRTLMAIQDADPTGVTLRISDSTNGTLTTVRAKSVILGLPTSALRRLTRTSPALRESRSLALGLGHIIESEAIKAYLAYETPWWEALELDPGQTVSDGPLKQTLYFPADSGGRALMLASYAFGDLASDFWGSVVPDVGFDGPTDITPEFSRQITAALSDVHGIEVPPPIGGKVHWWGQQSGVGVPFWAEGIEPWDYWTQALSPTPGLPIHICGDSLSMNQGWAIGAVATAEAILQSSYALSAPPWMGGS